MFGMRTGSRSVLRWAAPLAVVMVVAASGLVTSTATAEPKLPPTTPEQLLVDLQNVSVENLSGTVEQEANLGIPAIPAPSGSDSSEFNSLLMGKHRLGVWFTDPDKARIALYGDLGESDVITNGTDLWTWSSKQNKATHATVPDDAGQETPGPTPATRPRHRKRRPSGFSRRWDRRLTERRQRGHCRRACRVRSGAPAPRPGDRCSPRRGLPSTVTPICRSRPRPSPATRRCSVVAYTEIDFAEPDPKVFEFTPPPGCRGHRGVSKASGDESKAPTPSDPDSADAPKVVGEGWTTVVITKMPARASSDSGPGAEQRGRFLQQLPQVSGSWGSGRLLSGTAFTAVVTDDGRLAIGSVAPGCCLRGPGEVTSVPAGEAGDGSPVVTRGLTKRFRVTSWQSTMSI